MSTKKVMSKDDRREAAVKLGLSFAKKVGAKRVSMVRRHWWTPSLGAVRVEQASLSVALDHWPRPAAPVATPGPGTPAAAARPASPPSIILTAAA